MNSQKDEINENYEETKNEQVNENGNMNKLR